MWRLCRALPNHAGDHGACLHAALPTPARGGNAWESGPVPRVVCPRVLAARLRDPRRAFTVLSFAVLFSAMPHYTAQCLGSSSVWGGKVPPGSAVVRATPSVKGR